MRLRALLDSPAFRLRLLGAPEGGLDRLVTGAMTTDLRDPRRYLSGGELVLTGLLWRHTAGDSEVFVRMLAEAGVAGLAAGEAEVGSVPGDLIAACARHRLPVLAVPEEVSFAAVTEYVARRVSGERAGDLAALVDRHRLLMTAGPAGGGPQAVLDLLGSGLDLPVWLLSPAGRPLAGSAPALLPEVTGRELAARFAAAGSGRGPYRTCVGDTGYALFPVREPATGPPATLLPDQLLAVAADTRSWPVQRLDLLEAVARLIAAGRRLEHAVLTARRRAAQEVLDLVQEGAPAAEVAARLRAAAPPPAPGRPEPHRQWVAARLDRRATEPPGAGAGPDSPADTGSRALLEELLAALPAPLPGVAVARGGEAVALVPVPDGAGPLHPERLLGAARPVLTAALGDAGRIALGSSAGVSSAESLHGALEEALHALRVATAGADRVAGTGHEELASHVTLLPFVPQDVRQAYSARLLDPLRAYDQRHRSALLPTLRAFLAADCSWSRCAAALHLHVNTLRYRIGRIEELTGRDLSRLEDRLDLFLALRLTG
ncbi:helix-turn-helix domain-containing protein [Streptomyces sp. ACA25]|uniref:PucR family transcriptional regulator n=1 Tax=Streptomyces sp. ACA25 TaxID=3022596 RepID=UPI002307E29A|nr:PucR family transcriptional regulator [Streptomyces sp. ACA25]MDB1089208.1 helix-turn-helix domain-containing protein [Streptomyces sp. ACA25]